MPQPDPELSEHTGRARLVQLCAHLEAALRLADEGGEILLGAKMHDVLSSAHERVRALGGDPVPLLRD